MAGKNTPLLDLHGKNIEQALKLVDAFLHQHSHGNHHVIKIMTGKGSGKILGEVKKYLKQAGYPFRFESLPNGKQNKGVLDIFMN